MSNECDCLSFCDLEGFNKALLAKQVGRVLTSPSLLVSRVLKAVILLVLWYWREAIFHLLSFFWKSFFFIFFFLWERDLLCWGLHKRVGSGLLTQVFKGL